MAENQTQLTEQERAELSQLGLKTLKDLMTPEGVLASGRDEVYGCIFGRDSLIIALKLMSGYERTSDTEALDMVRTILHGIVKLQGTSIVPESGEEPGKCIHEWRPNNHERLSKANPPWYVYPSGELKNYEGVDETGLLLLALGRYIELVQDEAELAHFVPHAKAAHQWIRDFGDKNGDGFTDFSPRIDSPFGGLFVQSWMDSHDSLFHEDGTAITWPAAPVEVQAYTFAALSIWSGLMKDVDAAWSAELKQEAVLLKKNFNERFVTGDVNVLGTALDGAGKLVMSARSSQGHVLFANVTGHEGAECILDTNLIPALVERLMKEDLFHPLGGIRTLSTSSVGYVADSYHNGPIWPHDAGMIAEGFERFGYIKEASRVRTAIGHALAKLGSPYEYYQISGGEVKAGYQELTGHGSCRVQGWTAATLYCEMAALLGGAEHLG